MNLTSLRVSVYDPIVSRGSQHQRVIPQASTSSAEKPRAALRLGRASSGLWTRGRQQRLRDRHVSIATHASLLEYVEPVFRPPAEWQSLILQVTNGCSWNRCTFCDMYTAPQKKYKAKSLEEIERDIAEVARVVAEGEGWAPHRVFLADGDAMTLPFAHLRAICQMVKAYLPSVDRITSYCLPRNIRNKSTEQLAALKAEGLSILYVGCESGDTETLACVSKGETYESTLAALQSIQAAKIKTSVMILNGVGGTSLSEQHAINSARLMNEAQPNYLSTLVLSFPVDGSRERVAEGFEAGGRTFEECDESQLLSEMLMFVERLDLRRTIFRSDHNSNHLVLKGVLGRDKDRLVGEIQAAMEDPTGSRLRPAWMRRGL